MLSTTTAGAAPVPRQTRCSPGGWTKERELRQRRVGFARRLLPVLWALHRAGVDTNRGVAEALNARGVVPERARPWSVQMVAMIRYRLLVLGANPPPPNLPPLKRRRFPRSY